MSPYRTQNHDAMLRQAFYSFCDSEDTSDLKLVGKDGFWNCHKLIVLKVFPQLQDLFCKHVLNNHETPVIIFPDVGQSFIKKARDDLYLFSDIENMKTLLQITPAIEEFVLKDEEISN